MRSGIERRRLASGALALTLLVGGAWWAPARAQELPAEATLRLRCAPERLERVACWFEGRLDRSEGVR